MKKKGSTQHIGKIRRFVRNHKTALIIGGIILLILLIMFGTKIALLFNFILGNDIMVKLESDAPFLNLVHGEQQEINFKASVTTNPFCKAICTSEFEDISLDETIEKDEFTLRPSLPLEKKYTITPPSKGSGIKLYRFDIECHSVPTVLCHTSEEATTRSALVTVRYDLTEEEKKVRQELQQQLKSFDQRMNELYTERYSFLESMLVLNQSVDISELDEEVSLLSTAIRGVIQKLRSAETLWKEQNIPQLQERAKGLNDDFTEAEEQLAKTKRIVDDYNSRHTQMLDDIKTIQPLLAELRNQKVISTIQAIEINQTIVSFNTLPLKITLAEKENKVNSIVEKTILLYNQTKNENIQREADANTNADVLCTLSGNCPVHDSIETISQQELFSTSETCVHIQEIVAKINDVNELMKDAFDDENYPDEEEFWGNISAKVKNNKQTIINDYREQVPLNSFNRNALLELLTIKPLLETEDYPSYNLTPALVSELQQQQPELCSNLTFSYEELIPFTFIPLQMFLGEEESAGPMFDDVPPQCCVFGKCRECCVTESCQNDPATFPVVFVHGHAVSKDTSFEYSLEGFNQIQEKLEEEGYLNAGAITVYTTRDIPEGIWGQLGVPLTLRGSYYFDLFQQPENYIVVQSKSENIETYAIRLKEVIDTIKYKTGKQKVNIVAFSMGGLVSRKYIQLFGTDSVHKLVMIGTPNHGIQGDIAEYCPLTGEKLECRDMDADSLFMNKLNRGKLPAIPIYNIVGTGCDMEGKPGDGAVLEESSRLEGAQNFIINGTCRGKAYPLHLDLRNMDKYPKVFEIVKKGLKE